MKPKVLLIIPAFNEEKSLISTLSVVSNSGYDYVVINDGSTDSTEEILNNGNYNHISLISNLGIGGAVQTGYKYAYENSYDIAIQFDADGQHDISFVPDLIKPIVDQKANLAIGSCFIDKKFSGKRSSIVRSFGIKFLSGIIFLLSHKHIYDPTSGFRAADRKIIELFAEDYPQEYPEPVSNYELLRSKHFKIKEVPVKMNRRTGGKSSIHSWKSAYAAINVVISILILSLGRKKYD